MDRNDQKPSISGVSERADWRSVEQLYRQFSAIVKDPEKENILPDVLSGTLAESLGRVLAHYDNQERQYMVDLFEIWSSIEGFSGPPAERFRRLYYDERLDRFPVYHPQDGTRRRPKPFESSIETCRRLLDLNRVRDILESLPTAGILGGSASYGRFFNVCGASTAGRPSDTDLLLILPDYDHLSEVSKAVDGLEGFNRESLGYFKKRIELFHSIRGKGSYLPCILSHKLKFWDDTPDPYLSQYQIPGYYQLSMHIFSKEDFEYMIVKNKPILEPDQDGNFVRVLFDYRDTPPTRNDNQRSFSGIDASLPLQKKELEGGFISQVRVYHIEEDRFYPGLHQNLILPQFEIRWETPLVRIYIPVMGFKWKVLERLREERRLRQFEVQALSSSHTRSAVFAPHIMRRVDHE
jgi:hypothetical protein